MKSLLIMLTLFSLIFSGCSQKEPEVRIEYKDRVIKAPIYEFEIVDINGSQIEIKSAYYQSPTMLVGITGYDKNKRPKHEIKLTGGDVANICGGYMELEKTFYRTIIDDFYVRQILEYRKFTKDWKEDGK